MAFRVLISNFTSVIGASFANKSVAETTRYCEHFALSFVANGMLVYGKPIKRSLLERAIADASVVPIAGLEMPQGLADSVAKNVPGIDSVTAMYLMIRNGIAVRLAIVSTVWEALGAFRTGTLEVTKEEPAISEVNGNCGITLRGPF